MQSPQSDLTPWTLPLNCVIQIILGVSNFELENQFVKIYLSKETKNDYLILTTKNQYSKFDTPVDQMNHTNSEKQNRCFESFEQ